MKPPSIFRRSARRNRRTSVRQRRAARRVMFFGDFAPWQGAVMRTWRMIRHRAPGLIGSPLVPHAGQPLYDPIRSADTMPTSVIESAWELMEIARQAADLPCGRILQP